MPRLGPRTIDFYSQTPVRDAVARQNRKNRVMSIVADGFPVPKGRPFELIQMLRHPVMDLGGVSKILRAEPLLGTQILGILNSSPIEEYRRPSCVSEAVVLLGAERLRMLVFGCALADFAGRHLSAQTVRGFWHHSILTALLSQKIAAEVQPEATDQAYFGGRLHDIGRLPLLIVAHEEEHEGRKVPAGLHDEPSLERAYFGVDHCEVGRWIACGGSFSPWMVDVIEHHHEPAQAAADSALTAIVATGDQCCQNHSRADSNEQPESHTVSQNHAERLFEARPSNLIEENRAAHSHFLQISAPYSPFPRFGSS